MSEATAELEQSLSRALKTKDRVEAAQKKIDPVFKDLSTKVPAAIKNGNRDMMQFHLRALRVQLNAISSAMQDIMVVLNEFALLEEDEDFLEAHLQEIKEATEFLSDARTALTQKYKRTKELENDTENGLKSRKGGGDDFFIEIARLDKGITEDLKLLAPAVKRAENLAVIAEEAIAARNVKALEQAQRSFKEDVDVPRLIDYFQERDNELRKLLKDVEEAKPDAKTASELKDAISDLQARLGNGRQPIKNLQQAERDILTLKIITINVKECLKVLGLDPKAEPKLAKILKGKPSDYEKGLGALAKELKLKTTGKEMLAKLKNEGKI